MLKVAGKHKPFDLRACVSRSTFNLASAAGVCATRRVEDRARRPDRILRLPLCVFAAFVVKTMAG
jgi:hypothetical protein